MAPNFRDDPTNDLKSFVKGLSITPQPTANGKDGAGAENSANATPAMSKFHMPPGAVHLRILQTTDLHMRLLPYDYTREGSSSTDFGLIRCAPVIKALRQAAPNSLLFDTGDSLQGNALGDYLAKLGPKRGARPHPMVATMNLIGYDAATLGNHDFNYGLAFLQAAMADAQFPVVCANAVRRAGRTPEKDKTLFPPWVILKRRVQDAAGNTFDLRIAVIGFIPPQVPVWDHSILAGQLSSRDILQSAQAWVPLARKAGADLVVALAHSGIGADQYAHGMEHACLPLARAGGVDVILAGHSHQVFPRPDFPPGAGIDPARGTLYGCPTVMAGFWGSHVGMIDLALMRGPKGWQIVQARSLAMPLVPCPNPAAKSAAFAPQAPAIMANIVADHQATLTHIGQHIATLPMPLDSGFALVADTPLIRMMAEAQRRFIRGKLRGGPYADLPLLSAAAPFKAGGWAGANYYCRLPAGPLALRNMCDIYPFPNKIRAVKLTGADLTEWLERCASIYFTISPSARDAPLINPAFPSYQFDIPHGAQFEIDLSQPARYDPDGTLANDRAHRIVQVSINGAALAPDAAVIVATNDYRANGGGRFAGCGPDRVVYAGRTEKRDIIARFLRDGGMTRLTRLPVWRFAPNIGASAVFDSHATAALALPLPGGPRIDPLGPALSSEPNGFARFRLHF